MQQKISRQQYEMEMAKRQYLGLQAQRPYEAVDSPKATPEQKVNKTLLLLEI
jgi:hypothetical protein